MVWPALSAGGGGGREHASVARDTRARCVSEAGAGDRVQAVSGRHAPGVANNGNTAASQKL